MATPLATMAERIAPTRATTDYFNPAAGQSVMSRYANAGRRLEDSALAADAGSRLLQSRGDRLALRGRQIALDRDEEEYREKQDFKVNRGRFLEQIASINPEAEDFDDQISRLYTGLPAGAMDDDAVTDLLAAKRATAADVRNERQMQARRDEEFQNRLALLKERYNRDPRLAALTPEERDRFFTPDGEFDSVGAAQLAYQKARQDKKADTLEVAATKRQWKIEDMADKDLDDAQKRLKTLAKEHAEGDATAFPSQVEAIRQKLTKDGKPPKEEDLKKDPGYAAARKYDSSKFVSELESARNMTQDEYVAAGGTGLDGTAKEKRRTVWQAAQAGGTAAPPATPATAKALDRDTAASILQEAGGDKAKARQLARERGYSF